MNRKRVVWAGAVLAFTVPLLAMAWLAPGYLLHRGFPLDDVWIHMVYGRSIAREGLLAYNPGISTVGETSPLWALLLAIPHALGLPLAGRVAWVKLAGWTLHVLGAWCIGRALLPVHRGLAILAGLAILLHPELAAAAVSGMEVPLAEALVGLLVWAVFCGPAWLFGLVAVLAPFGRPEIGILAPMLGLLCAPGGTWPARRRWGGLGLAGAALGYGLMFGRCYWVSGAFMPATFHAKVLPGLMPKLVSMGVSLSAMVPSIVPVPLVGLVAIIATLGWMVIRQARQGQDARPALLGLTGVLLFAVCGALVYPSDIPAFYHRRYLLVGLPLFLVGAAHAGGFLARRLPALARWALAAAWVGFLLLLWPARFQHLDNDAHNIDDVQVALGRTLSGFPASSSFWAVDAGAVRYFGKPFVVDTVGLNTPEINGPGAEAFLAAHPAGALEVVPSWNDLELPPGARAFLQATVFSPSTPYTVTLRAPMADHYLIVSSRPVSGRLHILRSVHTFSLVPLALGQK